MDVREETMETVTRATLDDVAFDKQGLVAAIVQNVEDGEVRMPLAPTFFAARFGMLSDRFGVGWMVIVPSEMK